jgi:hypothetical protein
MAAKKEHPKDTLLQKCAWFAAVVMAIIAVLNWNRSDQRQASTVVNNSVQNYAHIETTTKPELTNKILNDTSAPAKHASPQPPAETNTVTALLPSMFNDADIFVDGKSADITDRTPSVVTLRIVGPEGLHIFRFKKGSIVREVSQYVSMSHTNTLAPFSN